jgi:hypothetical protein
MASEPKPTRKYFNVVSIFLLCTAVILFEIFVCEYGETGNAEWSCMAAGLLNLGVSILLKTYV